MFHEEAGLSRAVSFSAPSCQRKFRFPTRGRKTYPNHLRPDLDNGLVFRQRNVRDQRSVAGDRGVGVALDVGAPFPAGGVWVASTDVLGLEALEFLLVAELVGLGGG